MLGSWLKGELKLSLFHFIYFLVGGLLENTWHLTRYNKPADKSADRADDTFL